MASWVKIAYQNQGLAFFRADPVHSCFTTWKEVSPGIAPPKKNRHKALRLVIIHQRFTFCDTNM